jgi:hypothetical protein
MQIASGQFLLNFVADATAANDFVAGWGTVAGLALGLRAWFDGRWDVLGAKQIAALPQPSPSPAVLAAALSTPTTFAVEPGADWALFFVEWENSSPTAAVALRTPLGQLLTEAEIDADPSMALVPELSTGKRRVVRVDAPSAGTWSVTLADETGLGAIDVAAYVEDHAPSIAAIDAAGGESRQPVRIDVEAYDADSQATIALFYDTDGAGFDGIMIADGLAEADGATSYVWNTAGVAAGEYRIYARIMDAANVPTMAYGAASVQISDPPPTFSRRDVAALAQNFGRTSGATAAGGDLTGDGRVDLADLAFAQQHWAGPTPSPPTPAAALAASPAAGAPAAALVHVLPPAEKARLRLDAVDAAFGRWQAIRRVELRASGDSDNRLLRGEPLSSGVVRHPVGTIEQTRDLAYPSSTAVEALAQARRPALRAVRARAALHSRPSDEQHDEAL